MTLKDMLTSNYFDFVIDIVIKNKPSGFDKRSTVAYVVRGNSGLRGTWPREIVLRSETLSEYIACHVANTLNFKKHSKPEWLPITSDLMKLRKYLTEKIKRQAHGKIEENDFVVANPMTDQMEENDSDSDNEPEHELERKLEDDLEYELERELEHVLECDLEHEPMYELERESKHKSNNWYSGE